MVNTIPEGGIPEPYRSAINGWSNRVRELGRQVGYGFMMNEASRHWKEDLEAEVGHGGGAFSVGPCQSSTTPCGCTFPGGARDRFESCDVCYGCGWRFKGPKVRQEGLRGVRERIENARDDADTLRGIALALLVKLEEFAVPQKESGE